MAPGKQTQAYYDDFSLRYEDGRGAGYHRLIDDLETSVAAPFARGRRVLEAGCGTGLILQRLAQEAALAAGFDLSPGMVRTARARGLNVVLGNITEIPFADGAFDVVYSFKVLAHVPDIDKALTELARVTAPSGVLLLEFYNPFSLRYLANRVAGPGRISEERTEADVFTRWDTPAAVKRLLPAGLHLEDFRGARVVTPAAFVHRLPLIANAIRWCEQRALDSPFRYLGGFLIAVVRKRA
jgi:ubiquinone/menaquinone biosynthesis C-methylase UbiE